MKKINSQNVEINRNKKAYNDGWDFSKLPVEEQKLVNKLYDDYDALHDIKVIIDKAYEDQNPELTRYLNKPGEYMGIIYSCEKVYRNKQVNYRMRVSVMGEEVVYIDMNYSLQFGVRDFIKEHFSGINEACRNLQGRWVKFNMVPYKNGKFCVSHMEFVDELIIKTYKDMAYSPCAKHVDFENNEEVLI